MYSSNKMPVCVKKENHLRKYYATMEIDMQGQHQDLFETQYPKLDKQGKLRK